MQNNQFLIFGASPPAGHVLSLSGSITLAVGVGLSGAPLRSGAFFKSTKPLQSLARCRTLT